MAPVRGTVAEHHTVLVEKDVVVIVGFATNLEVGVRASGKEFCHHVGSDIEVCGHTYVMIFGTNSKVASGVRISITHICHRAKTLTFMFQSASTSSSKRLWIGFSKASAVSSSDALRP